MRREPLFHPRVFDTPVLAEGYYKQNLRDQKKYAKETVKKLTAFEFKEGRILDAGCGALMQLPSSALLCGKSFYPIIVSKNRKLHIPTFY